MASLRLWKIIFSGWKNNFSLLISKLPWFIYRLNSFIIYCLNLKRLKKSLTGGKEVIMVRSQMFHSRCPYMFRTQKLFLVLCSSSILCEIKRVFFNNNYNCLKQNWCWSLGWPPNLGTGFATLQLDSLHQTVWQGSIALWSWISSNWLLDVEKFDEKGQTLSICKICKSRYMY